jgi:hypothetical protein
MEAECLTIDIPTQVELATDTMQQYICERFDVNISRADAQSLVGLYVAKLRRLKKANPRDLDYDLSMQVWLRYMLNCYTGVFSPQLQTDDSSEFVATATFHIGFLTLPETSEMLERLFNESPSHNSNVARSKMFTTLQRSVVSPVDATAAKVT